VSTGQIKNFTSIDSIYEMAVDPEIITDTVELSIQDAAQKIYDYLCDHAYL
jgi:adenylylsulfate kinase-like enzyme